MFADARSGSRHTDFDEDSDLDFISSTIVRAVARRRLTTCYASDWTSDASAEMETWDEWSEGWSDTDDD